MDDQKSMPKRSFILKWGNAFFLVFMTALVFFIVSASDPVTNQATPVSFFGTIVFFVSALMAIVLGIVRIAKEYHRIRSCIWIFITAVLAILFFLMQHYAADPTEYYVRYDQEQANHRPVSLHPKLHFFILNGTGSELEQGARFSSDDAALGAVSPAVANMFERVVVPQLNGIWDQCGIAFDVGGINVVRAEKVKFKNLSLAELFGDHEGTRVVFFRSATEGTPWIDGALPILGVPKGDLAVFITGYRIWNTDRYQEAAAATGKDWSILTWPHVYYVNESTGDIVTPKKTLGSLAHEIGHNLGLSHPGEDDAVPENKFSKFNLLTAELKDEFGLQSELIPEQCALVKANLRRR
ncbi:hypothetical protein EPO33_00125 [Patescibacteria group bacterium]|nr:MAG: hypothetical protein EPO33_00125 [Patescibacteria group bacterium]